MIDLDALKRELSEKSWYIDGGMANRELCVNLETALAIIARHVAPKPSPDRAALVNAVAVFLRRELSSPCRNHDYCDPEGDRIVALFEAAGGWPPVEPITEGESQAIYRAAATASPDRAALVETMARAIQSAVRKEVTMNVLRQDMLAAEAALAAVEAAGGWPPMEMTELKPFVGKDVSGE